MAHRQPAPTGEGWLESADWLARARRLGPLRYSDLGPRRLSPGTPEETEALSAWIAGVADRWWADAGRPDPYTLVVVSGDDGHLARAVLAAGPDCAPALRYVLVDPDHAGRAGPPAGLSRLVDLEEPAFLYPAAPSPVIPARGVASEPAEDEWADDELDGADRPAARGIGPLATFLTEVPGLGETAGAIIAVSALSRLPYELYERVDGGWCEVRVAASGEELVEIDVPGEEPALGSPLHPAGTTRWRRLTGAVDWLRRQLPAAETGVLAVVDDWAEPGDTDTLDLAQLRHVRQPLHDEPQTVAGTLRSVVTWRLG